MTNSVFNHPQMPAQSLLERIPQVWQSTKAAITQATTQATDTVSQGGTVLQRVSDRTQQTVQAASQTAGTASTTATTKMSQAIGNATTTAGQVRDSVTETFGKVSNTMSGASDQAVGAVRGTLQKAGDLSHSVSGAVHNPMGSFFTQWADAHPKILWAINHPLITLGLILIFILASWSLLRAIAIFTEQLWLAILKAPVKLGQLLWLGLVYLVRGIGRLLFRRPAVSHTVVEVQPVVEAQPIAAIQSSPPLKAIAPSPEPIQPDRKQQLADLMARLETLRQEQNQLLQEVAAIMALDEQR